MCSTIKYSFIGTAQQWYDCIYLCSIFSCQDPATCCQDRHTCTWGNGERCEVQEDTNTHSLHLAGGWAHRSQELFKDTRKDKLFFFFPLSKEPLSLLRRLVSTLYLDQLPSLIIFTVWSKTLRTAIKTEERLANKKLTASHSSSCFCHNVLIHKPVVQILHNKDDIWMACWLPLIII